MQRTPGSLPHQKLLLDLCSPAFECDFTMISYVQSDVQIAHSILSLLRQKRSN